MTGAADEPLDLPDSLQGRLDVLRSAIGLVRGLERDEVMFPRLCELLVAARGYALLWIGRAVEDGTVQILARAGPGTAYVDGLTVRWDGGPLAVGPSGRAIGSSAPELVGVDEPGFEAWRKRSEPYGFRYILALPFRFPDDSAGILDVYSDRDRDVLVRDIPFLEILTGMLALRGALSATETRGQRRLKRLESLWTFSFLPELGDAERFTAILQEGSSALGADRDFFGVLGHLGGDAFVVDSLSPGDHRSWIDGAWRPVRAGDRMPAELSLQSLFLGRGKALAWSDLRLAPPTPATERVLQMGWRSAIGTAFEVNEVRYVLMFASLRTLARPFDEEDRAYVDLMATFFAHALREMWQESQIRYQAEHDSLTGLINRAAFLEYFERALARARRMGGKCALIMLDLDHFKEVNDTLGHVAGDTVLREATARLKNALRGEEIISRLGGDEFAIVIRDAPNEGVIEAIAERIEQTFVAPFVIEHSEARCTASLGVAQFPADGETADVLLAHADAAMYQAKEAGRNRHQFFNESIQAQLLERRILQDAIRRALERDEFVLHYQPELDLRTGDVVGAEALIRWPRGPGEPIISPSVLIAFAEEIGMMRQISLWVMRRAIAEYPIIAVPGRRLRLFINLSSAEFGDAEFLDELYREYAGARSRGFTLGVEVTEAAALRHPDRAREILSTLREHGVEIALDDFGTGYSSLSMLKTLPIDILKIDRSFIDGITRDRNDAAIVRTIIAFAQHLGRRTVAEGVETQEQAELLRVYGCHYTQGFLLARPMLPEAFRSWSEAHVPAIARRPLEGAAKPATRVRS